MIIELTVSKGILTDSKYISVCEDITEENWCGGKHEVRKTHLMNLAPEWEETREGKPGSEWKMCYSSKCASITDALVFILQIQVSLAFNIDLHSWLCRELSDPHPLSGVTNSYTLSEGFDFWSKQFLDSL